MYKEIAKLCTPAKIYLAIAVVASILALVKGIPIVFIIMKIIYAFIWTFVLGFLCKKGYPKLSWFLVLLPYILIILAMLKIYRMPEEHKQYLRMLKLQGAYGQEPFLINKKEASY